MLSNLIETGFMKRHAKILGTKKEIDEFAQSMIKNSPDYIRANTLKVSSPQSLFHDLQTKGLIKGIASTYKDFFQVNWKKANYADIVPWIEGLFFVQDLASSIPVRLLDVKSSESSNSLVVDMCAAPGAKTTQIATLLNNKGTIIANDSNRKRLRTLIGNCYRAGVQNTIFSAIDGRRLVSKLPALSHVLLDSPCTGSGIIRNYRKQLIRDGVESYLEGRWNQKAFTRINPVQRELLYAGLKSLKPGGVLVYSICSLEPEEGEIIVQQGLDKYNNINLEDILLPNFRVLPGLLEWKGKEFTPSMNKTVRIYPHFNDTIGFFITKFRRD